MKREVMVFAIASKSTKNISSSLTPHSLSLSLSRGRMQRNQVLNHNFHSLNITNFAATAVAAEYRMSKIKFIADEMSEIFEIKSLIFVLFYAIGLATSIRSNCSKVRKKVIKNDCNHTSLKLNFSPLFPFTFAVSICDN